MTKRIFLVDNITNIDLPNADKTAKGIIYLNDDVLPHYEYFERNNYQDTAEGLYLNSDDLYT